MACAMSWKAASVAAAARVRVVAQLIDAETGNHIWAERYDRALEDVFAVQDEITMPVVSAILPADSDAEQQRALRKHPPETLAHGRRINAASGIWEKSTHPATNRRGSSSSAQSRSTLRWRLPVANWRGPIIGIVDCMPLARLPKR